ncbi:MAG TPA: PilN domain-containing protein [Candidatus Goldiibacteriota bacterium]|nr:PilN domain-containing protein [Candidatus Goldiibacteriota bacterium]
MWLESLVQDKEKNEGMVIKISGYSMSKIIIADFIKRLETNKRIMDITTVSIKENMAAGIKAPLVNFEISFLFKFVE